MEIQRKEKTVGKLARLVAGAGLAGLLGILPISSGCMPIRESQKQVYAPEEQRIYKNLEILLKSDPAEFEKEEEEVGSWHNPKIYCEKGVKLNYLFSRESPGKGRGRYVISCSEGIIAGYLDEADKRKGYYFGWDSKEKTVLLADSGTATAVKYQLIEKGWTKSTAQFGKGNDITSEEDINQNEHAVTDEEAMRFVKLGEKLREIFPAK